MDLEAARNFLIALLIGALVGIEREKRKDRVAGQSFGGIRTFILIALVGAAAAWSARRLALPASFAVALAVATSAVLAYKLRLLVILISGLSLVGYVAIRWLGSARGAALSGITGSLVSSTATTLSLARAAAIRGKRRAATSSARRSCTPGW